MEVIIIIISIIFIIFIWNVVSWIIEKHRQKVRDHVAHDVLDNSFDFEKEKTEILAINRGLSFDKTEKPYVYFDVEKEKTESFSNKSRP